MTSKEAEDFICINCTKPVASLCQTYENIQHSFLLECPNCGASDIYLTLTYSVLLLDLLLFKKRAYRHLLFNRGKGERIERELGRKRSLIRVGIVVLLLDSYIRCANLGPPESLTPFKAFGETLRYCFLETLSLHTCIAIFASIFQLCSSTAAKTRNNLARLPLTLLYTSLPTLFLLTISSLIFSAEYSIPNHSSSSIITTPEISPFFVPFKSIHLPFLSELSQSKIDTSTLHPLVKILFEAVVGISRGNLRSGVSNTGNVRGWASEAILRKGVGGSSTVVGVSVLLEFSKLKTCCLLGLAWCLHLIVLHAIDPWLL